MIPTQTTFIRADAASLPLADLSVDLVFGSPPYMDARTYGIDAQRDCRAWIEWMLTVSTEALRVCKGAVCWVVGGVTRNGCYWPGCEGLLFEWWTRGGDCWRPCYYHRVGIPGSGGKQWFRADVEYVLALKRPGALPWADNTAMGHAPRWAPGGAMSYRLASGARVNERDVWGNTDHATSAAGRRADGRHKKRRRPERGNEKGAAAGVPTIANPGNLIHLNVGGGVMGDSICHENEAPFPEALAEWFVRSLCPPGGVVLDPFSGSGTTACVAHRLGRIGIGIDIRENQCELGRARLACVQREMFA
jgi:hypothetical protein